METEKSVFEFFKPINLNECTKDEIREYFISSFEKYEGLFSSIKEPEYFNLCPDRLRLPLVFYYGHTIAVLENKLALGGVIKPNERINKHFDTMFETGVDEMSWDSIEHYRMGGKMKWPTIEEIKEFRLKGKQLVLDVIERTELTLPIKMDSPWWAILMGIEHENIHFETSSVLIRQYPIHMVTKPAGWKYAPEMKPGAKRFLKNNMVKVGATDVRMGKSYDFPSFGWDNEYGFVECKVTAFEASEFKVTNEEFLEFVLKGGYEDRKYWLDDGWKWRSFKDVKHPKFWVCPNKCLGSCGSDLSTHSYCQPDQFNERESENFKKATEPKHNKEPEENFSQEQFGYKYRLMFDVINMPVNWPVVVNYYEAKAYCKWKGEEYRVISEAEHNAIRDNAVTDLNPENDVSFQNNPNVNNNLNFGSSNPVDLYPPNNKGFYDVFGNVWEWTEDHFNALPGAKTDNLYDDFSTPCYDGRHNIIIGGSWASMGDVSSNFGRYMFRRHFFQHCGFRLVRSLPSNDGSKCNPQIRYVADAVFTLGDDRNRNLSDLDPSKYVINYYPTMNDQYFCDSDRHIELYEREILAQFVDNNRSKLLIKKTEELIDMYRVKKETFMHLGTSTGPVTFELAKHFKEVTGIDYCSKFLDIAFKLQRDGEISINLNNQVVNYNVKDNPHIKNIQIQQLTWLPNEIQENDLILFSMLDRVTNHIAWLRRFKEIVKPDGLLIVYSQTSKYSVSDIGSELFEQFDLVEETFILPGDKLTVWKMKSSYAKNSLGA